MKKQSFLIGLIILFLTTFSSCAMLADIFKAGMGFGVFIVVLVVALVIFLISRMGKNK